MRFFSIEGIDGSGKTTQAKMLRDYMKLWGREVILTKEPGGSETTKPLREFLINNELEENEQFFLFLADRAIHVRKVIVPALREGKTVICDRYHASTLQYQQDTIRWFGPSNSFWHLSTLGIYPDLTFIIDVPAEVAIDRLLARNETNILDSFDVQHVDMLRKRFLNYGATDYKDKVVVIDGARSADDIHKDIVHNIAKRIKDFS